MGRVQYSPACDSARRTEAVAVCARPHAPQSEADQFAAAESADTGKPLSLASALDVPRAVANLRFFAGMVEHSNGGIVRHGGATST